MSANQVDAWAFRPESDVEKTAKDFIAVTGWTKTKLINEAIRIAIPIILANQARKFASLGEPAETPASSISEREREARETRARRMVKAGLDPDHKGPLPDRLDAKKKKP